MLEIKNLSKSFGELKVLKSISFSVESGEVIGILGKMEQEKPRCLKQYIRRLIIKV